MSYTVLARKYRPQKFSDVIGQDHVVRTLKNALEQRRVAHGYIFSGHRGIGKTTIARILAMALNCRSSNHPVAEPCGECESCREIREGSVGTMDVIEIDAATNRGIEEVRGLIATATAEPARDRYRIFILDEAHQVTDAAFNALLKTLEEPPPWVVFMMATTQPEDIPQTIRSRCQHFSFHAVRFEEIVGHLRQIATTEGLSVDEEALALLAEAGDGSMRDALSIMDQAISCCGATVTAEVVRGLVGNVSTEVLERVMMAVHENSSEAVLRIVDKLMVEGQSATHFARQTVRFLRNALVAKVAGADSPILQVSADERRRIGAVAGQFGEEELTRFLQIMLRTHGDVSYKQEQRFHLELGLLKMVHAQRLLPLEQLLSGVSLTDAAGRTPSTTAASSVPSRTQPASTASQRTTGERAPAFASRPPGVPPIGGGASPFGQSPAKPSPLEADRARRSSEDSGREDGRQEGADQGAKPRGEIQSAASVFASPERPAAFSGIQVPAPQAFGPRSATATAPVAGGSPFGSTMPGNSTALAVAPELPSAEPSALAEPNAMDVALDVALDMEAIRQAVLEAMATGGSQMLVSALEEGAWSCAGGAVSVQVEMSEAMIGISYTREQEKLSAQAASRAAGRAIKVRLIAGAAAQPERKAQLSTQTTRPAQRNAGGESIKTRAADEPVVKRMMEKFGAEIRIVMDRSER